MSSPVNGAILITMEPNQIRNMVTGALSDVEEGIFYNLYQDPNLDSVIVKFFPVAIDEYGQHIEALANDRPIVPEISSGVIVLTEAEREKTKNIFNTRLTQTLRKRAEDFRQHQWVVVAWVRPADMGISSPCTYCDGIPQIRKA